MMLIYEVGFNDCVSLFIEYGFKIANKVSLKYSKF